MSGIVTITDVRAAGFCLKGVRRQAASVGFDFRRLVKEGIPIDEISSIDDANVQRVIRAAQARMNADV